MASRLQSNRGSVGPPSGRARAAERRRHPRRHLREAVCVSLSASETGVPWKCQATMLNASPFGIACRATGEDVRQLPLFGKTLRMAFALTQDTHPFLLTGRIACMTPGASPDQVILGIEFITGANAQSELHRFQSALELAATKEG